MKTASPPLNNDVGSQQQHCIISVPIFHHNLPCVLYMYLLLLLTGAGVYYGQLGFGDHTPGTTVLACTLYTVYTNIFVVYMYMCIFTVLVCVCLRLSLFYLFTFLSLSQYSVAHVIFHVQYIQNQWPTT